MQYGFLIDHRRCIGCHACTVACKQENDVPVGDFRTWVKYVEKGRFPEIKRHFAVLRCNHCSNAPCVKICPVNALEKRSDGIVDLDRDVCIGCRACMQACPYDAIYLNDENGCVEKCHFCAHRIEKGLEPACVIVCPEQAIVAGDLDDPKSRISGMVKEHKTLRRGVEQKTGPNVHYLGVEPIALHPGAAARPETYLWSERPNDKPERWPATLPVIRDARVTLDVGHKVEWGWPVALYLVTKGIAAGAALLAPFAARLGLFGFAADWLPEILALVFVTLTTFLLVEDLARPKLFLTLLTRGNTKSWLVKGAYLLIGFSTTVAATLAARWFGLMSYVEPLRWMNALLGLGVAGYTAFLFGQCEGRDLWQSKLLLPHLLVQAVALGAAVLLPFSSAEPEQFVGRQKLANVMVLGLVAHLLLAMVERWGRHPTDNGKQGAAFLDAVKWGGLPIFRASLFLTVPIPVLTMGPQLAAVVTALVLLSIFWYESAYVRAAQLPPLS